MYWGMFDGLKPITTNRVPFQQFERRCDCGKADRKMKKTEQKAVITLGRGGAARK
jgi:hypothetical protein